MRILVLLIFILLLGQTGSSQTPAIERLKNRLGSTTGNAARLDIILSLCEERRSLNSDTLYRYALEARKLSGLLGNRRGHMLAENYLGFSYLKQGLYDSIILICDKNLGELQKQQTNQDVKVLFLNLKALTLLRKKKYKESLKEYYEVLDESERMKDTLYQVIARNGIGLVYKHMGQPEEAINWYYAALKTSSNPYYCDYYNAPYSNMATAYTKLNRFDSAEVYIRKAIHAARKYQILDFLSGSLCELANIYIHTNRSALAEEPLNESLKIRQELNDPVGIILDKGQLSVYYSRNGAFKKGIQLATEGIGMAEEKGLDFLLPQLYEALGENYKAAGDYRNYSMVLTKLMAVKDSSYNANAAEVLVELQAKYQDEKKENIITQQKLFITQQKLAITKKNYWLYGSLVLVLFAGLALYMAFKNYRRKQQMQLLLMLEKQKQHAEKAVLDAEEKERKRIAADLHDNLGAYAASIASNIDQIRLPVEENTHQVALQELRNNSQSIVSQLNDTIWVLKKDALSLTAISDRLKSFIQRVQVSHPGFRIDVNEKITSDHMLPPSQAFHLFQVLQEGVINAIRHSGGNEITITIEGMETWRVTIADNGLGIGTRAFSRQEGNGLENMRRRCAASGWNIQWKTIPGGGTMVKIEPTTN